MSRFEKEGNTALPKLKFVITAAKMLGVSIDTLLFQKIEEYSSEDDFLLAFTRKVLSETKNGKVEWKEEDPKRYPQAISIKNASAKLDRLFTLDIDFDEKYLGFYLDLYEYVNPETGTQYIELWACNENDVNSDFLTIAGTYETIEELDILTKELFDFLSKKPKIADSIYYEMLAYLKK